MKAEIRKQFADRLDLGMGESGRVMVAFGEKAPVFYKHCTDDGIRSSSSDSKLRLPNGHPHESLIAKIEGRVDSVRFHSL